MDTKTVYVKTPVSEKPEEKGFYHVWYKTIYELQSLNDRLRESHGSFLWTGENWVNHDCPPDFPYDQHVTHWLKPSTSLTEAVELLRKINEELYRGNISHGTQNEVESFLNKYQ